MLGKKRKEKYLQFYPKIALRKNLNYVNKYISPDTFDAPKVNVPKMYSKTRRFFSLLLLQGKLSIKEQSQYVNGDKTISFITKKVGF